MIDWIKSFFKNQHKPYPRRNIAIPARNPNEWTKCATEYWFDWQRKVLTAFAENCLYGTSLPIKGKGELELICKYADCNYADKTNKLLLKQMLQDNVTDVYQFTFAGVCYATRVISFAVFTDEHIERAEHEPDKCPFLVYNSDGSKRWL